MMKQKEAVFLAISSAQEQGLEGDQAHEFAVEQVKQGFMTGEISHSAGVFTDEGKARSYARSVIANWKKKDDRLNGGVKYEPETKRGPQVKDELLKTLNTNLKSLKANNADMELIKRVETAIEARRETIAQEKASTKVQSLDDTLASLEALGIAL